MTAKTKKTTKAKSTATIAVVTLNASHPGERYYRCGLAFSKSPQTLPLSELDETVLVTLQQDTWLDVELTTAES